MRLFTQLAGVIAISTVIFGLNPNAIADHDYRQHNRGVIDAVSQRLADIQLTPENQVARRAILTEIAEFSKSKAYKKQDILFYVFKKHQPCTTLAGLAAHYQFHDILIYLARRGANMNATCSVDRENGCATPFVTSIIKGDEKSFTYMLKEGGDLASRFRTRGESLYPIQIALRNGKESMALRIWAKRPEFVTPQDAHLAVRNEMGEFAFAYYQKNPQDITEEVFLDACRFGNTPLVRFALIEANPHEKFKTYVELRNRLGRGETPAMLAAKFGHLEVLRVLLKAGASISALDSGRRNMIDYALKGRNPDVLFLVLEEARRDLLFHKLSDKKIYRLLKSGVDAGSAENFAQILKFLKKIDLNLLEYKDELVREVIQSGNEKIFALLLKRAEIKLNLDQIKGIKIGNPGIQALINEYQDQS